MLERYSEHPSFAYWYLGYEIYLRWDTQAQRIRELYKTLTDICHTASNKPVTLSPFFMLDRHLETQDFIFAESD